MTKLLTVLMGVSSWKIIILLYILITIYITISGIWGIIVTDFFQFIIAMIFLSMARLIWKKGVQRYESASS